MTWQLDLSEFDYKLEYQRGKDNEVANALSRLPTAVPIQSEIRPDEEFFKTVCSLYKDVEDFGFV